MKYGYPPCPCATCQEVLDENDGARRPCEFGRTFDNSASANKRLEEAKDRAAFDRLCGRVLILGRII